MKDDDKNDNNNNNSNKIYNESDITSINAKQPGRPTAHDEALSGPPLAAQALGGVALGSSRAIKMVKMVKIIYKLRF
jgi:hypothetical protein